MALKNPVSFVSDYSESTNSGGGSVLHHVPFHIEFEGSSNVANRFTNSSKNGSPENNEDQMKNTFRGRPLDGKEIKLPEGFEGVVAVDLSKSGIQTDAHSTEKSLNIVKKFDAINHWNWDKPTSAMDSTPKLIDWLQLSQVLHQPIVATDADKDDDGQAPS